MLNSKNLTVFTQDRGLAVQVPSDPGDSTITYCYCTFLWNSFMCIVLNRSHHFQVEILRKGFRHESSVRSQFSSKCSIKYRKNEFCFYARVQNCLKRLLASLCLFFCPSVHMEQLGSHWTDFHEIWYLSIFRTSLEQIEVSWKSDKNNGTLHEDVYTFVIISRWLLRMYQKQILC